MKLIYRANILEYTPRSVQPYIKPRAMNWRFQLAAAMHSELEHKNMGCPEM